MLRLFDELDPLRSEDIAGNGRSLSSGESAVAAASTTDGVATMST